MSRRTATLLALTLLSAPARADSSHVALHATQGATTVTVFTAPDPLVPGPIRMDVLVQDAQGSAITGAQLLATLTSEGPTRPPQNLPLTVAAGGSLFTASMILPGPGTYRVALEVRRPGQFAATFSTALLVESNAGRRIAVIVALVVPLLVIALFLANQHLKAARRPPIA